MGRDCIANVVERLSERGFDPRKVGADAWESHCPAHRSADRALSITRNELNHLILECRSAENCGYSRIIRALGFTNDHVYAEVPEWLISRLSRVPIQAASFRDSGAEDNADAITVSPGPAVPPPHTISLPDGASATRGSECPAERKDAAFDTVLTGGSPPAISDGPTDPHSSVSRPTGERSAEGRVRGNESAAPAKPNGPLALPPHPTEERSAAGRVRGDATSTPAMFEPELCDAQRTISSGNSLELAVSVTSVTESSGPNREGRTAVAALARLASSAQLFRSADGRFYAQVPVGDRLDIYGLRSRGVPRLADRRLHLIDQPEPPLDAGRSAASSACSRPGRDSSPAFPRCSSASARRAAMTATRTRPIFVDLGDPSGRAVAIRGQGWSVVDRPDGALSPPRRAVAAADAGCRWLDRSSCALT